MNSFKIFLDELVLSAEKNQFLTGPNISDTGYQISVIQNQSISNFAYGLRDRKNKLTMTTNTVFPLASLTKAFTAAALLKLLHDQNISLQTPVHTILKDFKFSSPHATENTNSIDLLSHRSGLPRHDTLFIWGKLPMSEIYSGLKHLEMHPIDGSGFRSSFQYNNICYALAGELISTLSGQTYEDYVKNHILKHVSNELWMNYKSVPGDAIHEKPYFRELEANVFKLWTTDPAASMWATLSGVAQWLLLLLNQGRANDGSIVIPESCLNELFKTHNDPIGTPEGANCLMQSGYGLGWFIDQLGDTRMIHHGGLVTGASNFAAFCPDKGIGVVVHANQPQSRAPRIIGISVLAHLLGVKEIPFGRFKTFNTYSAQTLLPNYDKKEYWSMNDSIAIESRFEGKYHHPAYGTFEVRRNSIGAELAYGQNSWPILRSNGNKLIVGVEWIGMPAELCIEMNENELHAPLNFHPGVERTVFRRA